MTENEIEGGGDGINPGRKSRGRDWKRERERMKQNKRGKRERAL